jgi:chorismate synthase
VPAWTRPRPGHADLPGSIKYGLDDLRLVAERASARETAARVAVGAVAKILLRAVNVVVGSYVEAIGPVAAQVEEMPLEERLERAAQSDVSCPDAEAAERMRAAIDQARKDGDSLGGVIMVVARGVPVGLGSHVHWDRRLDGRIAQALMSIPAIKGVEIGPAFENARLPGTAVHDQLYPGSSYPLRKQNRAGGLEGGMSNGEPILARIAMKPIPTTVHPLDTVDLATGEPVATEYQRSDVCAVPAAAVVAEAMLAWVLADALLEAYGGDQMEVLVRRVLDGR